MDVCFIKPRTLKRKRSTIGRPARTPVALTIAGSDSSAGAGIQADLKTFSAFGVYGLTAVTCVVAETPGKVSQIEPVSAEIVREQIEILAQSFPITAIKTGMLYSAEIISTVARAMVDLSHKTRSRIPLIVDPVMVATSGDSLLRNDAVELYEKELFPLATLITPNLDEAAKLLGKKINDRPTMENAARVLSKKYGVPVLLKGGHLAGNKAVDLLVASGIIAEFSASFVRDVNTHGTGCTYSAAIAAGLASGFSLISSIKHAKKFVTSSIRDHLRWGEIHALKHGK